MWVCDHNLFPLTGTHTYLVPPKSVFKVQEELKARIRPVRWFLGNPGLICGGGFYR